MDKQLNRREPTRNIIGQSVTLNRNIADQVRDFCHAWGVFGGDGCEPFECCEGCTAAYSNACDSGK